MAHNTLDPMTALGQMLWLCTHTSNYSQIPLGSVASGFQWAIAQNAYRIYRSSDGQPLGCVCWMWLHEAHEEEVMAAMARAEYGGLDMNPEWYGGDRLWFFNYIAPFGHSNVMADDLRHRVFPGVSARAFRIDKNGKPRRFALFRNQERRAHPG